MYEWSRVYKLHLTFRELKKKKINCSDEFSESCSSILQLLSSPPVTIIFYEYATISTLPPPLPLPSANGQRRLQFLFDKVPLHCRMQTTIRQHPEDSLDGIDPNSGR